jgi:hypothetical protein
VILDVIREIYLKEFRSLIKRRKVGFNVKLVNIFRILSLAIILSLLVVTIPVIPAYAVTGDESIYIDPDEGEIGDEIDIDGEDFEEDEEVYVYFTSENVDEGDDIDDLDTYERVESVDIESDGEFSTSFDVPGVMADGDDVDGVTDGDYYVFVTYKGDDEIVAVDEFYVEP